MFAVTGGLPVRGKQKCGRRRLRSAAAVRIDFAGERVAGPARRPRGQSAVLVATCRVSPDTFAPTIGCWGEVVVPRIFCGRGVRVDARGGRVAVLDKTVVISTIKI